MSEKIKPEQNQTTLASLPESRKPLVKEKPSITPPKDAIWTFLADDFTPEEVSILEIINNIH